MPASVCEANKHTVQNSPDFEQRLRPLRKRIYDLAYPNLCNREDAEDVTQ